MTEDNCNNFNPDTERTIYSIKNIPEFSEEETECLIPSWIIADTFGFLQNRNHFRFNTDTVLLARFMKIRKGDRILDIGTNNGALLVYAAQFQPSLMAGIEIQADAARLAAFNLSRTDFKSWVVIQEDILRLSEDPEYRNSFDAVCSNPPFFTMEESGFPDPEKLDLRKLGRIEVNLSLPELIDSAARLLKSSGHLFMVYRPDRIMELMNLLEKNHFGLARMAMVYDRRDRKCKSLLIDAVKDRTCRTKIEDEILIPL